ncbi:PCI-domain-containing protein [Mycena olivaceomarginata]|nr:PCI-domain-containing protein [Mycena olivaceomarginata]
MQGSDDEVGREKSGSADVENMYYKAKSKKDDNPEEALKDFRAIVEQETEQGDCPQTSTKLLFLTLRRPTDALATYTQLLTYTKSAVTRNYSEKSINGILDYVGGSKGGVVEVDVLERFYQVTKDALEDAKNERLSAKTNLKLAKLWLDRKEYSRLSKIIRDLHSATAQDGDDESQSQRGTQLLEIYALEIQMYNETRNFKKLSSIKPLQEIYNATNAVRSAIPHPRIMGVIKECGGKMWMGERQWNRASEDFFESFRNYDEAGSPQRIQVLKYLVLANMLTGSEVAHTKPTPQIKAMTHLVVAYQQARDNHSMTMDDGFIRAYIGELQRSLRTSYLIDLIQPHTCLELAFLAKVRGLLHPSTLPLYIPRCCTSPVRVAKLELQEKVCVVYSAVHSSLNLS